MNKIIEILIRIKNTLTLNKKSIKGFIFYIFILIIILFFKIYNKYSTNNKIKNINIPDELLEEKYQKSIEKIEKKRNFFKNNKC